MDLSEEEILFAKIAIKNRACSREKIDEAIDRVSETEGKRLADALVELGHLSRETARRIDRALKAALDQARQEPSPATGDAKGDESDRLEVYRHCAQCGRDVKLTREETERGVVFFGEFYCSSCAENPLRQLRMQDVRHARATRKLNLNLGAPAAVGTEEKEPETDEEGPVPPPPRIEAPAEEAPKKRVKKAEAAFPPPSAKKSAEKPPPLPSTASVDEIPEDAVREVEKLVSRGKRDLAKSRLGRMLKVSAAEADSALKRIEEQLGQEAPSSSRGLFGFASRWKRSATFSLNVRRKNWARVVEEGQAWIAEEPENVEVLNTLGLAYREEKKRDRAEKTFLRALEVDGEALEPRVNLADLLADGERFEEALAAYGKALEVDPEDERAARGRIRATEALGRPEEALETLERLAASEPKDVGALIEKQMAVHYGRGDLEEASKLLSSLLKKEKRPWDRGLAWAEKLLAENPDSAKAWRQLARIRERRGEGGPALEAYRRALAVQPGEPRSLKKRGTLAAKQGRIGEAVEALQDLVESGEGDSEDLAALARLLREAGRSAEAAERFKAWAETEEPDAPGLLAFGRTLVDLGRLEEADSVLSRAAEMGLEEASSDRERLGLVRLDGEIASLLETLAEGVPKPSVHLDLARRFVARGLVGPSVAQAMIAAQASDEKARGDAVSFLSERFEADPGDRRLAFFLSETFRDASELSRAADVIGRYATVHAHDAEANRAHLDLLIAAGRFEEALDRIEVLFPLGEAYGAPVRGALETLRSAGGEDPRIFLFLGRVKEREGDAHGAIEAFERYRKEAPDAPRVSAEDLAALYERAGDAEGMCAWAAKALAEGAGDLLMRLKLSGTLFSLDRLDEAETHLQETLEVDPGNRTATDLLARLEKKKREQQLDDLESRFRNDPQDAELGIELGKTLLAEGRTEEGVQILNRCRADRESGWKAMEALYSHYRAEGSFLKALAALKELMPRRRPPRDSREWKEITYRMGDLYLSLADPIRAGKAFFDIYKSDPGFRDVKGNMKLVEVLEELVDPDRAGAGKQWHLGIGGKVEGPFDLAEVKEWVDDDRFSPDDLVWKSGLSGWKRASEADRIGLLFKYRDRL